MPKDIFGKMTKGPSREEIEAEAAREVERLTRPPAPPVDLSSGGPRSPLEQMAEELNERKRPGRKRRQVVEDRAGFGGFPGAAAITGAVGSALAFGGGAGPGGRAAPPPPDAQPLVRRSRDTPAPQAPAFNDQYDDDDDDDVGVTELALRDAAARSGRNPEDMVVRSDPVAAESMREQALRRFTERQPGSAGPSASPRPGGPGAPAGGALGRLEERRRAAEQRRGEGAPLGGVLGRRMRIAEEPEPEVEVEDEAETDEPEVPEEELAEVEELDFEEDAQPADEGEWEDSEEAEELVAPAGAAATGGSSFGNERVQVAEERARVAEHRAEIAEERSHLAEERAALAERRADEAEQQAAQAADEMKQLQAELAQTREQLRHAEARAAEEASGRPAAAKPSRRRSTAATAGTARTAGTAGTKATGRAAKAPARSTRAAPAARPARAPAKKAAGAKAVKAAKRARKRA